jgi:biopolymer transport protein ExbB
MNLTGKCTLIAALAMGLLLSGAIERGGELAAQEATTEELGGAAPPSLEGPAVEGISPAPAPMPEVGGQTAAPQQEAAPEEGGRLTLWQMMRAGGLVMLAILILSVVALSLVIESFFSISVNRLLPRSFVSELDRHLEKRDVDSVVRHCEENTGPLSNIVRAAVAAGDSEEKRLEGVVAAGELEGEALFHRANYLSVFATIAPMLGLMGTVFGMIEAFNTVAFQAALGKPQLLAKGISEALITTAAGLVVGIPTMFLYFYFRSRGNRILLAMESGARALVEWQPGRPATATGSTLFPMRIRVAMEEALGEAIIGLFFLGFILGPLAIRKGLQARREAASTPHPAPVWKGTIAAIIGAFDLLLNLVLLALLFFRFAV